MFSIVISTSLYILNHILQSDLELENIETRVWLLLKWKYTFTICMLFLKCKRIKKLTMQKMFYYNKNSRWEHKSDQDFRLTLRILSNVLGHPLLMNRFDYFSNFHEYTS